MFKKGYCQRCGAGSVRCIGLGFTKEKPQFVCDSCNHYWSYGYDGGPFLQVSYKYHSKNRIDWPRNVVYIPS